LVLLLLSLSVWSYTRDLRGLTLSFEHEELGSLAFVHDQVVRAHARASRSLCETHGVFCLQEDEDVFDEEQVTKLAQARLQEGLQLSYAKFLKRWQDASLASWLRHADVSTWQHHVTTQRIIVALLYQGRVLEPKTSCNSDNNSNSSSSISKRHDCLFFLIVKEQDLIRYDEELGDRWVSAAERLFNQQLYDLAEALCYHLLFSQLASTIATNEFTRRRAAFLIAEVTREKGLLEDATLFSLLVMRSFSSSALDEPKHAIIRLRILLTVPPIPLGLSESQHQRALMLQDLKTFALDYETQGLAKMPLGNLLADVSATPFHIAHQGLNDLDVQAALVHVFDVLCPELSSFFAPHLLFVPREAQAKRAARVGFLSSHFYDHSIGRILYEMVYFLHEKEQQDVEVFVFFLDASLPRHEGEDVYLQRGNMSARNDIITQGLLDLLGPRGFVRVPDNLYYIRDVLSDAKLDFLLFADLGMDLTTVATAHARLATYQAAWWGHPITSGQHDSIDFFLGLDVEIPTAAHEHYSEQLVRMEMMNIAPIALHDKGRNYDQPWSSLDALLGKARTMEKDEKNVKLAVVLGKLFKLQPAFDEALVRLLYQTNVVDKEQLHLVLIAEKLADWNALIFERLRAHIKLVLSTCGNKAQEEEEEEEDLLLSRIHFINYASYYEVLSHPATRVVLDTFPYGGCLTTHDAFSMRIPLVTLPMEHVRGRYSLGMYQQMGHMDLVASNTSHYVALAAALVKDDYFWKNQIAQIEHKYEHQLRQNNLVAKEWATFIKRVVNGHF